MNSRYPIPLLLALVAGLCILVFTIAGKKKSESTTGAVGTTSSVTGSDEIDSGFGAHKKSLQQAETSSRQEDMVITLPGREEKSMKRSREASGNPANSTEPGGTNQGPARTTAPSAIYPNVTRAPDFPHNLKTFEEWETITAEEMNSYQRSLMSRVGRWNAEEIGDFFHRVHGQLDGAETKAAFRKAVLGTWCSKDVDDCLQSLEENLSAKVATRAKQDALAGFSDQDWMTALQYLREQGDAAIEERLGGDSSEFVGNVVKWMAREGGQAETEQLITTLKSPGNREAAENVYRGKKVQ